MDIKPIETLYNGYRFRSRLEARWAVFFDALDIRYEYEKQGFDLGKAGYYLPDFWLPAQECWVEIKGQTPTEEERHRAEQLATQSGHAVAILTQIPDVSARDAELGATAFIAYLPFLDDEERVVAKPYTAAWNECFFCAGIALVLMRRVWSSCGCIDRASELWPHDNGAQLWLFAAHMASEAASIGGSLITAYTTARQARFEHGQTPRVSTVRGTPRHSSRVSEPQPGNPTHELEEFCVGLLLTHFAVWTDVSQILDESDFTHPEMRALFEAIARYWRDPAHAAALHSAESPLALPLSDDLDAVAMHARDLITRQWFDLERVPKVARDASYRLKRMRLNAEMEALQAQAREIEPRDEAAAMELIVRQQEIVRQRRELDARSAREG